MKKSIAIAMDFLALEYEKAVKPVISPSAKIRSLAAGERAPRRLRGETEPNSAREARRARFDERVAPPTNEKSNPVGLLRSLSLEDEKTIKPELSSSAKPSPIPLRYKNAFGFTTRLGAY